MILGRTFTRQEDSPHGGRVVVLSYGLWQRRFGGDANVVGKSLSLGNEPYTVVGVVGKQFRSDPAADLMGTVSISASQRRYEHVFPGGWVAASGGDDGAGEGAVGSGGDGVSP